MKWILLNLTATVEILNDDDSRQDRIVDLTKYIKPEDKLINSDTVEDLIQLIGEVLLESEDNA